MKTKKTIFELWHGERYLVSTCLPMESSEKTIKNHVKNIEEFRNSKMSAYVNTSQVFFRNKKYEKKLVIK